ncbi:hypothetical protein P3X46_001660 [Hevea brasiliensis]|uniref:Late embryogenesis abundant protein LEA-2 subgroup domain-containing protein n=1 Tax=Hevea brasiliensis TaxID=3981 RepID=A0ABQ9NDT9_HEVBR|nr:uncharacterized protein LOC110670619 [Hevea brasiliensis]KAJ9190458.1 hypothetical protein P3X46_001660 [Hevea brasiliensis]
MDLPTQNSGSFCCQGLYNACSFKGCCLFAFTFLLFIVIAIAISALVVIFIFRPQEPRFSLSTIRVNSFRLSLYSSSTLFISSVVSLTLNAQNHNKVGIKYIPSKLNIYNHGIPIGLIRVPGFYQPAHSDNIKVTTQISLHCVNVSQILSESLLQDKARKKVVQVKAIGDIRVQLFLFRLASPKIKIALDCDIDLDYAELLFKNYELFNNMDVVQHHLATFPGKSASFSKKCTLALYL